MSESLGSSKGETFGFMPVGSGGAFGAAGEGLVGKFWNILHCSNWAFCKVSSSNSYSCNKCSVCCQILGGLELPWNGRITALMRAHRGQKSIGIFFPIRWLVQHSLWPSAEFLNQNCLYQGTSDYVQLLFESKPLFAGRKPKSPWTLKKWWNKVEKWWGFPAIWRMSLYVLTSIGPESLRPKCLIYQAPVLGGHLVGVL